MIYKERNPEEHQESGKMAKAGAGAEDKVAYYLRRAFKDSKNVHVLHNLRLLDEEDEDDVAQMDHLVLHRHGFIIVESKSSKSKITVTSEMEFIRGSQGIESPVEQAKRQGILLRRLLNRNKEQLLSKKIGLLQPGFTNCPIEIVVAYSAETKIDRKAEIPELMKADQVIGKVEEIYQRHKKASGLLSLKGLTTDDGLYSFSDDESYRLREFLVRRHTPRMNPRKAPDLTASVPETFQEDPVPYGSSIQAEPPPESAQPAALGQCSACGRQSIIKWGNYGYYWKCIHCDKNMPIKEYCPTCNKKMKLRKDGMHYFKRCDKCGTEDHYCVFEEAPEQ